MCSQGDNCARPGLQRSALFYFSSDIPVSSERKKAAAMKLQPNFCFTILQHRHTRATLRGHSDRRSSGSRLGSKYFCARFLPSQFPNGRLSSRFRSQRIQLRYSGGSYPISSSMPIESFFLRAHDTIKWIMKLERSGKPLTVIISLVFHLSMVWKKIGFFLLARKTAEHFYITIQVFMCQYCSCFSAVFTTFHCDFM